jgi:hypothetical protein
MKNLIEKYHGMHTSEYKFIDNDNDILNKINIENNKGNIQRFYECFLYNKEIFDILKDIHNWYKNKQNDEILSFNTFLKKIKS